MSTESLLEHAINVIKDTYGDVFEKTAATAEFRVEVRQRGKVFLPQGAAFSATSGNRGVQHYEPFLIVPKNSDVRVRAKASGAGVDCGGGLQGFLAIVK